MVRFLFLQQYYCRKYVQRNPLHCSRLSCSRGVQLAGILARLRTRRPTTLTCCRVRTTCTRPRSATLVAASPPPATRPRRCRSRTVGRRPRWPPTVLHPSPPQFAHDHHHLWAGADRAPWLLPAWRAQHLSARSSPGPTRSLVLLRVAEALGEGGRPQ